jgi:hypothetical protein
VSETNLQTYDVKKCFLLLINFPTFLFSSLSAFFFSSNFAVHHLLLCSILCKTFNNKKISFTTKYKMFTSDSNVAPNKPGFSMAKNFRFSQFTPRLYNYCTQKMGMNHSTIMPARAFCSDGSQGFPTMLLAKHFGTFPFDYGQIGGTFDFNRTPAVVTHGRDLVVVQATHVGYDPVTKKYGKYPRHRTALRPEEVTYSSNCGHVAGVSDPYIKAFQSAASHTQIGRSDKSGEYTVYIRNFFLSGETSRYKNHVQFDIKRMFKSQEYIASDPVGRTFIASSEFAAHLDKYPQFKNLKAGDAAVPLGAALTPEWFTFERTNGVEGRPLYEQNLKDIMEWVVVQPEPMLAAAQGCVQAEFHRFLSEIRFAKSMFDQKNMLYIAGVIVDVAPQPEQLVGDEAFFPRTLFIPWAAYEQRYNAAENKLEKRIWDQDKCFAELEACSTENPRAMVLDAEMQKLTGLPPIELPKA